MRRVSLDSMLNGKESKYALVIGVAKRARQLADENLERLKDSDIEPEEQKYVLQAIDEFKKHKFNILEPEDDD